MTVRWLSALVAVQFLLGVGTAQADSAADQLIDFRIKDQFGQLHTSGYFHNTVVILIAGDRKGSEYAAKWAPALYDSVAGLVDRYRVKFLPNAHLKGVPFFLKKTIKGKFPQEKKKWILMDYEGLFRHTYDLPGGMCSVVVFDTEGVRRFQKSVTEFDPEIQAQILATVRRWVR